jgi:parallel beta-helix repeat protein
MENTPSPFATGYRLTDGTQLNNVTANPSWSVSDPVTATAGGLMSTSKKITFTMTNVTGAAVPGAGVTLPQALPGRIFYIVNNSPNDIRVYADGDSNIDTLPGTVGVLLQVGATGAFAGTAVRQWTMLQISSAGAAVGPTGPAGTTGPAGPAGPTGPAGGGVTEVSTTLDGITIANPTTTPAISGVLALTSGGTGATTQAAAANALLPAQTTAAGKVLGSDGTNVSWVANGSGSGSLFAATISALRSTTVVTGSGNLTLGGYYADGDGGGGQFYGVTGGSYTDNGGTIITTGYGISASSAWISVAQDPQNVLCWGAYPDGTNAATTTTAIQNAITYVGGLGGGTVYFPKGTYSTNATLNVTQNSITLLGDNNRASYISINSTSATVLSISGVDTCYVRSLGIGRSVTHDANTPVGVSVTGGSYWAVFEDVSSDNHATSFYLNNAHNTEFYGCRAVHNTTIGAGNFWRGWYIDSSTGNFNDATVINKCSSIFLGGTAGTSYGFLVYGSKVQDIFFRDAETATVTYGIWVESTASANNYDVTLNSCIIDTFSSEGIVLSNLALASIVGCWINPSTSSSNDIRLQGCRNITVTGNELFGRTSSPGQSGIDVNGTFTSTIVGNVFSNVPGGIRILNGGNIVASANSFYSIPSQPSSYYIYVTNSYRSSVADNTMDGTSTYGVYLDSTSNYNSVIGNTINTAAISNPIVNNGGTTNNLVNVDAAWNTNQNVTIGGTLTTNGAATFSNTLRVTGASLTVTGASGILLQATNSNVSFGASATFGLGNTGTTTIGMYSASGNYWELPNTAGAGFRASGVYTNSSDIALKENISPITSALDLVEGLNGVYFDWKANPDAGQQLGFIAQDVEKVLPQIVSTGGPDNMKGIAYSSIVPVLVNAVKELKAQVDALKATPTSEVK